MHAIAKCVADRVELTESMHYDGSLSSFLPERDSLGAPHIVRPVEQQSGASIHDPLVLFSWTTRTVFLSYSVHCYR